VSPALAELIKFALTFVGVEGGSDVGEMLKKLAPVDTKLIVVVMARLLVIIELKP
jgi:hypothetical protein